MDTTGGRQRRTERAVKLVAGARVEMFATGRVCQAPDCLTVLSRYNPSPLCGRHLGWDRSAGNRRARNDMHGPDVPRTCEPPSDEQQADDPGATQGWIDWVMTDQGTDPR